MANTTANNRMQHEQKIREHFREARVPPEIIGNRRKAGFGQADFGAQLLAMAEATHSFKDSRWRAEIPGPSRWERFPA